MNLDEVLATLTVREAFGIRQRYLCTGKQPTWADIGFTEELGFVTRERSRQIGAKALRKLRHPSRDKHLKLLDLDPRLHAAIYDC